MPAQEADDLVQETWRELLEARQANRVRDCRLVALRIARDLCAAYHRQRRRAPPPVRLTALSEDRRVVPLPSLRVDPPAFDARTWIAETLAGALADSDPPAPGRQLALVELLAGASGRRSTKHLARKLGCQPQQVRRDIIAIATRAKKAGLACTPLHATTHGGGTPRTTRLTAHHAHPSL